MMFRQVALPSGAVARVCVECAADFPQHQYFCSAVAAYSRSAVLREMVRVEDALAAAAGGATLLLRCEFWDWAWWIGLDFWTSTLEQRDAIRAEVAELRARTERQFEMDTPRQEDAAA